MINRKKNLNNYGSAVEESAERDSLFSEENSHRRIGEFCDSCGKKKDTKKYGKFYLCTPCRKNEQPTKEN